MQYAKRSVQVLGVACLIGLLGAVATPALAQSSPPPVQQEIPADLDALEKQARVLLAQWRTTDPDHRHEIKVELVKVARAMWENGEDLARNATDLDSQEKGLRLRRLAVESVQALDGVYSPYALIALSSFGSLLLELDRPAEAEPYLRRALDGRQRVLGLDNIDTFSSYYLYGLALDSLGRWDEADLYFHKGLEGYKRILGTDHVDTRALERTVAKLSRERPPEHSDEETVSDGIGMLEKDTRIRLAQWRTTVPHSPEEIEAETAQIQEVLVENGSRLTVDVTNNPDSLNNAIRLLRLALEAQIVFDGENGRDTITSLRTYGKLIMMLHRYEEAEPYLRRALDGSQRLLPLDHPDALGSLSDYGHILILLNRFDEAELYLRRVMEGRKRTLPPDHLDTLSALHHYGNLLIFMERFSDSEPYFREALEGYKRTLPPNHASTLAVLDRFAFILRMQDRFAEAEPLLRAALEGYSETLSLGHHKRLKLLQRYGSVLSLLGRLVEAEMCIREVLEGFSDTLPPHHSDTLSALRIYSSLLQSLGRFAEAEICIRKELDGYLETLPPDHPDTLESLNRYGLVLMNLGRLPEAQSFILQALEGCRRTLPQDHSNTLQSLNNYGLVLFSLGRFAKAEPYLREALDGRLRTLPSDHPDSLLSLTYYGLVLHMFHRFAKADQYFRSALEGAQRTLPLDHPLTLDLMYITVVNGLRSGSASQEYGRLVAKHVKSRGEKFVSQAVGLDRTGRQALFRRSLEDKLARGIPGYMLARQLGEDEETLRTWLEAAAAEAWEKVIVTEAARTRHTLMLAAASDPTVATLLKQRKALHARLNNHIRSYRPDRERDIAGDRNLLETLERQLNESSDIFSQGSAEQSIWISEVVAALRPQEAIIDFVRFHPLVEGTFDDGEQLFGFLNQIHYAAVIVRRAADDSADIRVVDLGPAEEIEAPVKKFRSSITNYIAGRASLESKAAVPLQELYGIVWKPLVPLLDGITRVYVSPEGKLHGVPFEALVTGREDGVWRYLLESGPEIVYVTIGREVGRFAIRARMARENPGPPPGPAVLIGDPDFNASVTELEEARTWVSTTHWPGASAPLAAASATHLTLDAIAMRTLGGHPEESWEARPVTGQLLDAAAVALSEAGIPVAPPLTKDRAIEEAVTGLADLPGLGRPRILQIATHGMYVKAPTTTSTNPEFAEMLADPMMRSALVLAGRNTLAKQADDEGYGKDLLGDGLLTAMEVAGLDLRGTQLVVLTACHSGEGDEQQGEGVSGLTNAFLVAGADAVISSRWEVLAWLTIEQMKDIYAGPWLKGAGSATSYESFRASQLAALQRARRLASLTDADLGAELAPEASAKDQREVARKARKLGFYKSAHPATWAAFTYTGNPRAPGR